MSVGQKITTQNQYMLGTQLEPHPRKNIRGGGGRLLLRGAFKSKQDGRRVLVLFLAMSARKPFIGGNWKCNLNTASIQGKPYHSPPSYPPSIPPIFPSSSTSFPTSSMQHS